MRCGPERIPSSNYGTQPNRIGLTTISDTFCASTLLTDYPGTIYKHGMHSTAKPVPLEEYLIKTYTDPGAVVLDCYMGSGTTGIAAVNTGRRFVGIELDEHYYQIAKKRITEAINNKAP